VVSRRANKLNKILFLFGVKSWKHLRSIEDYRTVVISDIRSMLMARYLNNDFVWISFHNSRKLKGILIWPQLLDFLIFILDAKVYVVSNNEFSLSFGSRKLLFEPLKLSSLLIIIKRCIIFIAECNRVHW
jgi:hypothetical protein